MRRKSIVICIAISIMLLLAGCGSDRLVVDKELSRDASTGDSWTVMIYVSASSLEDEHNRANDLLKNISYDLPENINVIIETGGSKAWDIDGIDHKKTQDFAVQKNGIRLIHERDAKNMGDGKTYEEFLSRTIRNYPADRYISVIWGEGGNPVSGVGHDITNGYDSLTLNEISDALSQVGTKLDIIGFDSSTSASLEMAYAVSPYADYMVAAQDVMPITGWDYRGLFELLSVTPDAGAAQVGQKICEDIKKNAPDEVKPFTVISVIDLGDIPSLVNSFDSLAKSMSEASENIDKLRAITAYMNSAQYMGANSEWEGYSNLVDLDSFALSVTRAIGADINEISHAISKSVIYKATGKLQKTASGLSVYYPKTGDSKEINKYKPICPSLSYCEYIDKIMPSPTITDRIAECKTTQSRIYYESVADANTITAEPDLNGEYRLDVANPDIIAEASVNLYKYDEETGKYLYLYNDNAVSYSNIANQYEYTLHNNQFELNKIPVSMYLVNDYGNKQIYSIPVIYKKKVSAVRVLAETEESETDYTVLGIWGGMDKVTGILNRNYESISVGDTITPIYKIYGGDKVDYARGKDLTIVFGGLNAKARSLDDGEYILLYTAKDIYGKLWESNTTNVTAIKGKMQISK